MITIPTSSDRTTATIGCTEFLTVFVATSRARDGPAAARRRRPRRPQAPSRTGPAGGSAAAVSSVSTGASGARVAVVRARGGLRSAGRARRLLRNLFMGGDLLDDLFVLGFGLGDRASSTCAPAIARPTAVSVMSPG